MHMMKRVDGKTHNNTSKPQAESVRDSNGLAPVLRSNLLTNTKYNERFHSSKRRTERRRQYQN